MAADGYRWALALILLSGAAVRFLYFSEVEHHPDYASPMLDARYHDYWARAIATGDWSPPTDQADPQIQQHPYVRPPLYPFFLAAIYKVSNGSFDAPRAVQFLAGLVSAWLAAALARRWFGMVAGLCTAGLMSWLWIFPYYEAQLVEPSLIIPLLLGWVGLTVYGLQRKSGGLLFLSGLLLGLIVLGRPNALLLAPAIAAWTAWSHWLDSRKYLPGIGRAVLLLCGVALAVAPAVIRNLAVSGEVVPVTAVGGQNLYLANNPLADGYSGIAPDIRNWSSFDHARLVRELGVQVGRNLSYSDASTVWTEKALRYMREHPARVLQLTGKKILLLIGPREVTVDREDEFERADSRLLRVLPGGFSWILAGALISLLLLAERDGILLMRRHDVAVIVITLAVFGASYIPFTITGRYRVPLIPLLLILLSYAVQKGIELAAARSWRPLASWLTVAVMLFMLLRPNYTKYEPSEARWLLTRGLANGRAGRTGVAADYLRRAVELAPGYSYARLNYGVALARLGHPEDAMVQLEESARIDPQAMTFQVLGSLKKTQGDYEGAERALREALRLSPSDASVCNDLGILFAESSRMDLAIEFFRKAVELDSGYFEAYRNLAVALEHSGKRTEAMSSYERAASLNPTDGHVIYGLAKLYGLDGRYQEAIELLYRAIALQPENAEWLGALAWIRATHPNPSYRNGFEALALAERSVSGADKDEPTALVVLAAAKAELGDFDGALQAINRALPLAEKAQNRELQITLLDHAKYYRAGKPFRDSSMTAAR